MRLARIGSGAWHTDPAVSVLANMGRRTFAPYKAEPGGQLFPHRRALLRWEATMDGMDAMDLQGWLQALDNADIRAPGQLDPTGRLMRRAERAASALERQDPAAAEVAWGHLARHGARDADARRARCLERLGRSADAVAILNVRLPEHDAIGKRLSRALGKSWPPLAPRDAAPLRDVRLPGAGRSATRPLYATRPEGDTVEAAVTQFVRSAGREVVAGEGRPWAAIASVLCAELLFLPLPGALPVPFLDAPVDYGTRAFARSRAAPIATLKAAIGRDPQGIWRQSLATAGRWQLRGRDPTLRTSTLDSLATAAPTSLLQHLVDVYVGDGIGGFAGWPDLSLPPGPSVVLPDAFPPQLPVGLVLAELKTPGDALAPHQARVHHQLLNLGVCVELWRIRPSPSVDAAMSRG